MNQRPRLYAFLLALIFAGCTYPPKPIPETPEPALTEAAVLDHGKQIKLIIPFPAVISAKSMEELSAGAPESIIQDWIPNDIEDSLRSYITNETLTILSPNAFQYMFSGSSLKENSTVITFSVDSIYIKSVIEQLVEKHANQVMMPIEPLFSKGGNPPGTDVFQHVSLSLPCEEFPVPSNANLLPNAPRTYRNGIHRGIDFWADWGTPVKSAAVGTVIRADHEFSEVSAAFRANLLKTAHQTGHTPSDIFNHILLGQAIFIDHGFSLVPGFRAVSIYAHLSHINADVTPGTFVDKGQVIGLSGNSGIKDAAEGKRTGAHLHWELILQDAGGEYYLGQGIPYDTLYPLLTYIFR